jgi:hypothetical protein
LLTQHVNNANGAGCANARFGSSLPLLPTITWMLTRTPLIATLVIAGDPCHKLLGSGSIVSFNRSQELLGVFATQGSGNPSAMQDVNDSIFPGAKPEAKVVPV